MPRCERQNAVQCTSREPGRNVIEVNNGVGAPRRCERTMSAGETTESWGAYYKTLNSKPIFITYMGAFIINIITYKIHAKLS